MIESVRRPLERTPAGYRYSLGRVMVIYGGLMTVVVLGAMDETIVATALPAIVSDLGGLTSYPWAFTAYLLFQTVSIPIFGRLGDVHGRRTMLLIAISIFLVGSALCGLAQTMPQLITFRSIQGIGAGGLVPLAHATIGEIIPPRDRGRYQGLMSATFASAAILGPVIGGAIVDHSTWRWIFYVNLPVGLLALGVIAATVPAVSVRRDRSIDWLGAALLAAGCGTLLLALSWAGGSHGWASRHVLGAGAAGLATLVVFALQARSAREPILPFAMLRTRTVAAGSACVLLLTICMYGIVVFVPLFTQEVLGASATSSGAVLTPFMLGAVASSVLSGQWMARTGRYRASLFAGTALLTFALVLLWRMDGASSVGEAARNTCLAGAGIGLMNPVLLVVTQNAVPHRLMGSTIAFMQFSRSVGAVLGATLFGLVVSHGVDDVFMPGRGIGPADREALASAIPTAFLFALFLCAPLLVLVLRGIKQQPLRTTLDDLPAVEAQNRSDSSPVGPADHERRGI